MEDEKFDRSDFQKNQRWQDVPGITRGNQECSSRTSHSVLIRTMDGTQRCARVEIRAVDEAMCLAQDTDFDITSAIRTDPSCPT